MWRDAVHADGDRSRTLRHRDCIRDRIRGRPFGIDLVLPKGMPERDDRAAIEAEIPDEDRDFVADLRVPLRRP